MPLKGFISTALAALLLTGPGTAQGIVDSMDQVVTVDLLSGWREDNGTHVAGIRINLAPGWKTYWRAPGDGGIPTRIQVSGSSNIANARVKWPRPEVFRVSGLRSIGYHDQVVLPLEVDIRGRGAANAKIKMHIGVCKEICLPVEVSLSGYLHHELKEDVAPIKAALNDRPRLARAALTCELTKLSKGYQLKVSGQLAPPNGQGEAAVIEVANKSVWVGEPELTRQGDQIMAIAKVTSQNRQETMSLKGLRLTLLSAQDAVEVSGCT